MKLKAKRKEIISNKKNPSKKIFQFYLKKVIKKKINNNKNKIKLRNFFSRVEKIKILQLRDMLDKQLRILEKSIEYMEEVLLTYGC